ncbi:MAG: PQQ-binding-like beta-propeller repeat protein [Bdellovibrionota bacterium]
MTKTSLRLILSSLACSVLLAGCQHSSKTADGGVRTPANTQDGTIWNDYGGIRTEDRMGEKHSPLKQIDLTNVKNLKKLWVYNTGEKDIAGPKSLEVTPIFHEDRLYGCTIFNKVFALDAETGKKIWEIDPTVRKSEKVWAYKCRGVALWTDPNASRGAACSTRILTNTIDGRLLALDAKDGKYCQGFTDHIDGKPVAGARQGEVAAWVNVMSPYIKEDRIAYITRQKDHEFRDEYYATSAPLVVGDIVILGGGIADNGRVNATAGAVQAFDARTGALRWTWDPAPAALTAKANANQPLTYGTPNVWAPMAVDESRGLVFLPTGAAAPDYYAANRNGKDLYANSVVALRVKDASGNLLAKPVVEWQFKTVIQDKWDYDVASQPVLSNLKVGGKDVPVVIQGTKMGFIFIMHRETGRPIFPTKNGFVQGSYADLLQPVAPTTIKGETNITQKSSFITEVDGKTTYIPRTTGSHSQFQPFPPQEWRLHHTPNNKKELQGFVAQFLPVCKEMTLKHDYQGYYTPPSMKGAINFPGAVGGIDWGGVTVDPVNQILYVNQIRVATIAQMLTRQQYEASNKGGVKAFKEAYFEMKDTPYGLHRFPYMDAKSGLPCSDPAYGILKAVSLKNGEVLWSHTFGDFSEMAKVVDEEKAKLEKAQSGEVASATDPRLRDSLLQMIKEIQTGQPSSINDPKVRTQLIELIKQGVQKKLAEAGKLAKKGFVGVHSLSAGVPNFGGSLVTEGGILFIAAAADAKFRMYNSITGELVHQIALDQFPGAGSGAAVPMTYMTRNGKQVVVIASGGNKFIPGKHGDAIVAFALE